MLERDELNKLLGSFSNPKEVAEAEYQRSLSTKELYEYIAKKLLDKVSEPLKIKHYKFCIEIIKMSINSFKIAEPLVNTFFGYVDFYLEDFSNDLLLEKLRERLKKDPEFQHMEEIRDFSDYRDPFLPDKDALMHLRLKR